MTASGALTANPTANGSAALWAAAVPFVAAIVLLLISPLLASKIKAVIRGQISDAENDLGEKKETPLHLIPDCIDDYIEYAADEIQIFPLALLPVTGAIFAIAANVTSVIPLLVYLGVVIVVAIGVDAWVLSQAATMYVGRDRFGCSVTTIVGILSNLAGLVIIVIYRP